MLPHNPEKLPIEKLMLVVDKGSVEIKNNKGREEGHTGLVGRRLRFLSMERDG
jgi:hypothetical protein